jgi:hypothetical protein
MNSGKHARLNLARRRELAMDVLKQQFTLCAVTVTHSESVPTRHERLDCHLTSSGGRGTAPLAGAGQSD